MTLLFFATIAFARRQMENAGRGVLAVRLEDSAVFVIWELLNNAPGNIAFHVYHSAYQPSLSSLHGELISTAADLVDQTARAEMTKSHFVKPVAGGKGQSANVSLVLPANAPAGQ